jgi:hypothetical protein
MNHGVTGAPCDSAPSTEVSRRKVFSLCLCVFVLSLFFLPAAAQNATILPVLDPATIFAAGVEVVETLHTPLVMDNEQRVLFYRQSESDGWSSASYPDGTSGFSYFEARNDGTYLLLDQASDGASDHLEDYSTEDVWVFDPVSRTVARPASECGFVKALLNEGKWRWLRNEQRYDLCNTENGELIVLPQFIADEITATCSEPASDSIESSPTKRWIVFSPCYDNGHYGNVLRLNGDLPYIVYAYDTQTTQAYSLGRIESKGQFEPTDSAVISRWINDTTFIVETVVNQSSPYSNLGLYVVTVNEPDSLRLIAKHGRTNTYFFDHPPRYIWFNGRTLNEYRLDIFERRTLFEVPPDNSLEARNDIFFSVAPAANAPLIGYFARISSYSYSILEIYDLTTGEQVYKAKLPMPEMFTWLDAQTFLYVDDALKGIRRVMLAPGYIYESFIPHDLPSISLLWDGWSPDNRYILLKTDPSDNDAAADNIDVYNWQQQHAIFQPLMFKYQTMLNRRFVVYWQPDSTLAVQIWDQQDGMMGSWRIRIDNLFAEAN